MIKGLISGASSVGLFLSSNKRRQKGLSNMRAVNLKAVITMEAWVKRNFNAEGRLHKEGRLSWPALSASTIEKRRKGGASGNPKILQDTGNLKNRWSRSASAKRGVFRSQQNYSGTHENGRGIIPQRKIFPTEEQGQEIVRPVYEGWIKKVINK